MTPLRALRYSIGLCTLLLAFFGLANCGGPLNADAASNSASSDTEQSLVFGGGVLNNKTDAEKITLFTFNHKDNFPIHYDFTVIDMGDDNPVEHFNGVIPADESLVLVAETIGLMGSVGRIDLNFTAYGSTRFRVVGSLRDNAGNTKPLRGYVKGPIADFAPTNVSVNHTPQIAGNCLMMTLFSSETGLVEPLYFPPGPHCSNRK